MNSIDACEKLEELVIAARFNSDNIHFNWDKWEEDVDYVLKATGSTHEPFFYFYRNAIKYTVEGLPVDQAIPHKKPEDK